MFLLPDDFEDPQVSDVLGKISRKVVKLPDKRRAQFFEANFERMIRRFTSSVVLSIEAAADRTLSSEAYYWDLVDACSHALGPDIVIEIVGPRTRRTAAIQDNDMDLQI